VAVANVTQLYHAFCPAAMDIHMGEPLQGHGEQSDGSVLVFLVTKDVPEELQSFMDLKDLLYLRECTRNIVVHWHIR
jgi:hypothetical protein